MRPLLTILALGLAVPASAQTAPKGITIRVVTTSGTGVESKIFRRLDGTTSTVRTDSSGTARIAGVACAANLQFKAQPLHPLYAMEDDEWRACEQEMTFKLRPMGYASLLGGTLQSEPFNFSALVGRSALALQASKEQAQLHAAAERGDWAKIALHANEQAAIYRQAGDSEGANLYSGLAIQAGANSIAWQTGVVPTQDPLMVWENGTLIESRAANDLLKGFDVQRAFSGTRPVWDQKVFANIQAKAASLSANEF